MTSYNHVETTLLIDLIDLSQTLSGPSIFLE